MNKLLQIDCMEYMKDIPDNHFDLGIVDPPYGIQKGNLTGFKKKTIQHEQSDKCMEWDNVPGKEYFNELFRITKNQIIWGMQYFTDFLPSFSQLVIWDKKTGSNFFADGEAAFCSIKGTLRIFNHQWCGAFKDSERKEKAIHVNQKPVALYKWLLTNYAKPGDKLFDSHSGSGSFRIAAYDMGFDLVSCELDSDYCRDNEARFQNHIKQQNLFAPEEIQKSIYKQGEF